MRQAAAAGNPFLAPRLIGFGGFTHADQARGKDAGVSHED